jgi:hypothetical protein
MEIKNTDGLSPQEIRDLVAQGGKFVMYKYCISILIMTFNRPSDAYFIRPNSSSIVPGLGYLFINIILGWWGIPWGPIYTIGNIFNVLSGGTDITAEIMGHINQNDANYGSGTNYNIGNNSNTSSNNSNQNSSPPIYNIPSNN